MKICHACQQTYSDDVEFCPCDGARLAAQATETEVQLAAGLSRRYRIIRRLGAGGMGAVFLAGQTATRVVGTADRNAGGPWWLPNPGRVDVIRHAGPPCDANGHRRRQQTYG